MALAPFFIPWIFIFFGIYFAAKKTIWMLTRRCILRYNSVNPRKMRLVWRYFGFDLWVNNDMIVEQRWQVDGYEQQGRQKLQNKNQENSYDIYIKSIPNLFDDYYYLNNEQLK